MKTLKPILPTIFLLGALNLNAQFIVKDTLPASMQWDFNLIDYPYASDAARTEAIHQNDGTATTHAKEEIGHYQNFYRNLSMTQSTDMAHNLHGTLYFGHNLIWNQLIKPNTNGKYLLNRAVANIAALGTDFLAIKLPYGYAFQHEEFHRSVMTSRHIYSYDEVWSFGKGLDIAVTHVKDEDLIYLKKNHPADLVRLAAAGVEGEYKFLQRMRADNFFLQTGYPMVGISLLGTLHGVNYVNLPFAERFNSITDSILSYDKQNVLARDFTGYDFSAWVYDLFTSTEPYENRGNWPDGVGIKRPIKESDLNDEMISFLRETGRMQYINFLSPFMVGINRLQFMPNYYFNFAFRSVPTSFGYYAGCDFFLDLNKRPLLFSFGLNRSKHMLHTATEIVYYNLIRNDESRFNTGIQLATWIQPKDQLYMATEKEFGYAFSIQPRLTVHKNFSLIADIGYKSKGWQFGNPYLDDNFTARFGLRFQTAKRNV